LKSRDRINKPIQVNTGAAAKEKGVLPKKKESRFLVNSPFPGSNARMLTENKLYAERMFQAALRNLFTPASNLQYPVYYAL
jgi:hypothetical protein